MEDEVWFLVRLGSWEVTCGSSSGCGGSSSLFSDKEMFLSGISDLVGDGLRGVGVIDGGETCWMGCDL